MTEFEISFCPITEDDLPLILKWRNTPHVMEWWDKREFTMEDIRVKYLPAIQGQEPTHRLLILLEGRPIGQIQTYWIQDFPEYASYVAWDKAAVGMDMYIGEVDCLHKGLGAPIIRSFLQDYAFANFDAEDCVIGPESSNVSAIRAYGKAGFRYVKTVVNPENGEEEYLMVISRGEL